MPAFIGGNSSGFLFCYPRCRCQGITPQRPVGDLSVDWDQCPPRLHTIYHQVTTRKTRPRPRECLRSIGGGGGCLFLSLLHRWLNRKAGFQVWLDLVLLRKSPFDCPPEFHQFNATQQLCYAFGGRETQRTKTSTPTGSAVFVHNAEQKVQQLDCTQTSISTNNESRLVLLPSLPLISRWGFNATRLATALRRRFRL